jgi:hypothetical protein
MAQANTSTIGPSVGISKLFFDKKLRTTFNYAYNTSFTNNIKNGSVMNFRLGVVYVIHKKHNFNLSILHQLRKQNLPDNTVKSQNTSTITLGYIYNFSLFNSKTNQSTVTSEKN